MEITKEKNRKIYDILLDILMAVLLLAVTVAVVIIITGCSPGAGHTKVISIATTGARHMAPSPPSCAVPHFFQLSALKK